MQSTPRRLDGRKISSRSSSRRQIDKKTSSEAALRIISAGRRSIRLAVAGPTKRPRDFSCIQVRKKTKMAAELAFLCPAF